MTDPDRFIANFRLWLEDRFATEQMGAGETVDSLLHEYMTASGIHDIDEYVGDARMLQEGLVHQRLTEELIAFGAKPKRGAEMSHQQDILERYRSVPLHAIFLYTSEDPGVAAYLTSNWGALNTLSGDLCDIHPIVDQFRDAEDAYDYIERLDVLGAAKFREYSRLPGLFFWDLSSNWEYVSFGADTGADGLRHVLRLVFEEVSKEPRIASVTRAVQRLHGIRQVPSQLRPESVQTRVISPMATHSHIFVSHSSQDGAWCLELVDALKAAGFSVWYDQKGLYVGDQWITVIEQELQKCDVFMVVLTPAAWTSTWVRKELQLALAQGTQKIIGIMHKQTTISGFLVLYQVLNAVDQRASQVVSAITASLNQPS